VRFISRRDFPAKGLRLSKATILRRRKLPPDDPRKFPDPVKGIAAEDVWTDEVIDAYIARQIDAASDSEAA
jgi:hypothetical protein